MQEVKLNKFHTFIMFLANSPIITHLEYVTGEKLILLDLHVANPWYIIQLHWCIANT
jgi:hypothetical protein